MNRPGLVATALLHGLALWAWSSLGDPPGARTAPPGRPAVAVRLLATTATPPRLAAALPLEARPPAPLLIAPLELAEGPREGASATSARLQPADPGESQSKPAPLRLSQDLTPPASVPSPSPTTTTAWAPATLPPDHQACRAQQAERHYPALLRDRGIEGRVIVRVRVDEDGRAAEVQVQAASGWRLLDEAARRVAAACPYKPARQGEQRLAAWIEYPIRFSLH